MKAFVEVHADTEELVRRRDPFGVEPFYYARIPGGLVVSNSLDEVLAHPQVSARELDAQAVGDYLATGVCDDAAATVYAQVRRLPPAHELAVRGGRIEIRRYWTLPSPKPQKHAPKELEEALRAAIRERLTASSAVVFLSGGLDSTALAALAREVAPNVELVAQTSVYRSRIPDVEERYAVEAARSIGIPIEIAPLDDYEPLQALDEGAWTADPGALLSAPMTRVLYAAAARHAPIALHGHPADTVLQAGLMPYLRSLGPLARLAALVRYTIVKRRPPYFFVRDLLGRPRRPIEPAPMPRWLLAAPHPRRDIHPLDSAIWSNYFEWAHPLVTGAPLQVVYPWLDVRVVEAAMALPAIPWLVDKYIVRQWLRGRVSESIRRRRKSFLAGDPWRVPLPVERSLEIEAASEYIDPERFRATLRDARSLSDRTLRAVAFEYWLRELPRRIEVIKARNVLKY